MGAVKKIAQVTIKNGSAVPPMASSTQDKMIWMKRFIDNQIFLKANVMAIQLAFIGLPLVLGLAAAAIMMFVPTHVGQIAGLIVGTAIFPSLGICWWVGKLSQPTHFVVYYGQILEKGTEQVFNQERTNMTVRVDSFYHLGANGLHVQQSEESTVKIAIPLNEDQYEEDQIYYFMCLNSNELIQHYSDT